MNPHPRYPIHHSAADSRRGVGRAALVLTISLVLSLEDLTANPAADNAQTPPAATVITPVRSLEYDYDPPPPGSYQLPVIEPAGDGTVVTADGNPCGLRALLQGRITLLSFIYTRCTDPTACPMVTGVLREVQSLSATVPPVETNLCLMTISFDPEHDTPQVMAGYGRTQCCAKGSQWLFLTTRDNADLKPILQHYGQRVARKRNPQDVFGPLVHNVRVFLIDRQGHIRNVYSQGLLDPRLVLSDVQTLLLEESAGSPP